MVNLYVFKSLRLPDSSLFTYQVPTNYQQRNDHLKMLVVPLPPCSHSLQATPYAGPATVKNLPANIRALDAYCTFKYRMRSYI